MSRIEKLVERLLSKPRDLTWGELVKVLEYFSYSEIARGKTGGSRRKFVDEEKNIISIHKPHPQSILKPYQVEMIVEHLKQRGKI